MNALMLTARPVLSSVDELLADATSRQPFSHTDSKSGSGFERVIIDGEAHVVKYVHIDEDWTMRFCGDIGCKPLQVWATGLMDVLPERIDHGVVGAAGGLGRNGWGAAILMRDLSDELVPAGDDPIAMDEHLEYIETMAALAARTWGFVDDLGLVPFENKLTWFNKVGLELERARGWPDAVPPIAANGWTQFASRVPRDVHDVVDSLRRDPQPLVDALVATPFAFSHGDWKLGNIGTGRDGRTVLIDWTYPGAAPPCYDLAWYISINRSRLPHSKEDAIASLRAALARAGIDVQPWWDRQLSLCLLGALLQHGWEKALGDEQELGWWCDRGREGARYL